MSLVDEQLELPKLTSRLELERAADRVELDPGAALENSAVIVGERMGVAVTDDDPTQVDSLVRKQVELYQSDRACVCMQRDRQTGRVVGAGGRAEHPLLDGRDPRVVGADLADDS